MKKYYVYAYLNIITGKIYIGWSINPKRRWKQHCVTKDNTSFHNAIQKYGEECFEQYIIAYSTNLKEIKQKEIKFIKQFNTIRPNGYNLSKGGDGNIGCHWNRSEESKEKNRQAALGKKRPDIAEKLIGNQNAKGKNLGNQNAQGRKRSKKEILKQRITCLKRNLKKLERE